MKNLRFTSLHLLVVAIVALLTGARVAEAVTCNTMQLSPCIGAITSTAPPSTTCCSKLREQQPCFCGYMKNPSLGGYVKSARAKAIISTCGVPLPKC
ncbi:non-specific lipid-transfer protein 2-like [Cucumis melo var. makuwa]|uniref:Non-specific lipid-transfer protein 2-like n=2 Tax=Cucumis melo var. makuwa TaxID=1194695 RepID=A0A5A7VAB3_CUCMM|nr:non-specific lipid-transfer protein 2-like [Cucumis melo var. makuwa]